MALQALVIGAEGTLKVGPHYGRLSGCARCVVTVPLRARDSIEPGPPLGSRCMETRPPTRPDDPPGDTGGAGPLAEREQSVQSPRTWLGCFGALLAGACWVAVGALFVLSVLRATGWDVLPYIPAAVAFTPWA